MEDENNQENLISKLLKETIQELPPEKENSKVLDFSHYFDQKSVETERGDLDSGKIPMLDFIKSRSIQCSNGEYIQPLGCFRFIFHGKVLDFPRNWSIFAELYDSLIYPKERVFYQINGLKDQDNLFEVLSRLSLNIANIFFLVEDHEICLVSFSNEQESLVVEFLSCLEDSRSDRDESQENGELDLSQAA